MLKRAHFISEIQKGKGLWGWEEMCHVTGGRLGVQVCPQAKTVRRGVVCFKDLMILFYVDGCFVCMHVSCHTYVRLVLALQETSGLKVSKG